MTPAGCGSSINTPRLDVDGLVEAIRAVARQEAQAVLREALRDAPGSRPTLSSLTRYARSQGLGVSTLRRWCRTAGVRRQACGRFLAAELDQVVATHGAPLSPPVSDLVAARARRAAESLRGGRP